MAGAGGQGHRPLLEPREAVRGRPRGALGRQQDGPGAMGQQAAEVHIPTFADATEVATIAGGGFSGRQAEPAGELSGSTECVNVVHGSDEGR